MAGRSGCTPAAALARLAGGRLLEGALKATAAIKVAPSTLAALGLAASKGRDIFGPAQNTGKAGVVHMSGLTQACSLISCILGTVCCAAAVADSMPAPSGTALAPASNNNTATNAAAVKILAIHAVLLLLHITMALALSVPWCNATLAVIHALWRRVTSSNTFLHVWHINLLGNLEGLTVCLSLYDAGWRAGGLHACQGSCADRACSTHKCHAEDALCPPTSSPSLPPPNALLGQGSCCCSTQPLQPQNPHESACQHDPS
jgi:hypothetical protein